MKTLKGLLAVIMSICCVGIGMPVSAEENSIYKAIQPEGQLTETNIRTSKTMKELGNKEYQITFNLPSEEIVVEKQVFDVALVMDGSSLDYGKGEASDAVIMKNALYNLVDELQKQNAVAVYRVHW